MQLSSFTKIIILINQFDTTKNQIKYRRNGEQIFFLKKKLKLKKLKFQQ